ncbi:hypothetical protein CYMTET_25570 [Cymbomonas tetramitiformis]|uniref:Glutamate-1-semialdehyde 2,1-aminomutase n=1 Tax=Cymbomonas tetramitiformis TaxID=36881 RepID=A0AAE0KZ45_9CHLO|nr:hypothetical protein CYMTET_25570 [Cymbomonas tetramitiformis]
MAPMMRSYSYTEDQFYKADGADVETAALRKKGMNDLAQRFKDLFKESHKAAETVLDGLSDMRFTDTNRVPFPCQKIVREKLNVFNMVTEARGAEVKDLDGNWAIDVSGSYGVNVAGYDVFKNCLAQGWEKVKDLGCVLGPLHPIIEENVEFLKHVSGQDEVSFHMSGTEAVMCAVRLACFNTRRSKIAVFSGAYHGWWDGVQPGAGNERIVRDCVTLKDLSPASLTAIAAMGKQLGAVLVNPLQCFHPNSSPPSDVVLMDSKLRNTADPGDTYRLWLHKLRKVCTENDVPLVFDEVYTGFRLARGGAQEYFGVKADMVVYGKTIGGGMPNGLVCGPKHLMRRFDLDHPLRVSYVIGTFAAHPLLLGSMNEFIKFLKLESTPKLYESVSSRFSDWVKDTNSRLIDHSMPLRIVNLSTIWTILYTQPGRYNWMLQYYLRAEGVMLSWVGTGRCLISLDFTDQNFADLQERIIIAAQKMQADGWWWKGDPKKPITSKVVSSLMAKEMAYATLVAPMFGSKKSE